MENNPIIWDSILFQLMTGGQAIWGNLPQQEQAKRMLIAGGCVRDYMLGLPYKDIDVFVSLPEGVEFIPPHGWDVDVENQIQPPEIEAYNNINGQIRYIGNYLGRQAVVDGVQQERPKIQVIVLRHDQDVNEYVDGFDYNLCMGRYGISDDREGLYIPYTMLNGLQRKRLWTEAPREMTHQRMAAFLQKIGQFEQGWGLDN